MCFIENQKSWNFEVLMFEIMKSGFYCTNLKQINFRKLLNLLFKHISPMNGPEMAIIIPICFPMIFHGPQFNYI